jgi:acid phosphatase
MGSESYEGVVGNPVASYTNRLASTYGFATKYYAVGHPSLPNYLAMIAGSTKECTTDVCPGGYPDRTLVGQLRSRGLSWAGYFEDLPHGGYVGGDQRGYVRRHNPFLFFQDVMTSPSMKASLRPLPDLFHDLPDPPAFSFIVPNIHHLIQNGSIAEGDEWLRAHVDPVIRSNAFQQDGAIFITWAESANGDRSGCCLHDVRGGRVPLIAVLSRGRRAFQTSHEYCTYSLLRTIQEILDLPSLARSGAPGIEPMTEFWPPEKGSVLPWPSPWSASGHVDFGYGTGAAIGGLPASGNKPENKLFYTQDHRWWAVLGIGDVPIVRSSGGPGVYLLELAEHHWQPIFRLPGADPWERADTAIRGRSLYIALRDNRSVSGNLRTSHLYKLVYLGAGIWRLLSGPTLITADNPETLAIAPDGRGRVWVTYRSRARIRVGVTEPGRTNFTFSFLPNSAVTDDDISAIVLFGTQISGPKIGVMWSDERRKRFMFAWRLVDAPTMTTGWHVEIAYGERIGGCPTAASDLCADDHINIKADGDHVFASVKTGLGDAINSDPNDPLIVLLRRDAEGRWSSYPVSLVRQKASRPITVIAPYLQRIFVFAQKATSGIYVWQSPLASPAFNETIFLPWTISDTAVVSDPTSTSQTIVPGVGIVVVTSTGQRSQYWHNEFLP